MNEPFGSIRTGGFLGSMSIQLDVRPNKQLGPERGLVDGLTDRFGLDILFSRRLKLGSSLIQPLLLNVKRMNIEIFFFLIIYSIKIIVKS